MIPRALFFYYLWRVVHGEKKRDEESVFRPNAGIFLAAMLARRRLRRR